METRKFKIQGKEKSGKNNSKSFWSKAGFTFAGATVGSTFATILNHKPTEDQASTETTVDSEQTIMAEAEQQPVENVQPTTNEPLVEPQPIDEPQPVDGTHSSGENVTSAETTDNVDPNLVAQAIAQEVDPNDIDSETILTVDGFDYAYLPDGTRQMVVIGHTPDGEQFVLADLDGDGVYNDVYDTNGNYVAEVDGVSVSDLAEMVDETGGYIAGIAEPWEDGQSYGDGAEVEEVSEEELLAQLTEEFDKEEDVVSEVVVEEEVVESLQEESEDVSEEDEGSEPAVMDDPVIEA